MRPARSDIGPFTIVPVWLLEADLSDRAVRLFAVLGKFANQDGQCFPARATLARALRASPASVDRAVAELRAVGAVITQLRRDARGDLKSSLFMLRYARPAGGVITGDDTPHHGRRDPVVSGDETVPSPLTTELDPPDPDPNERTRSSRYRAQRRSVAVIDEGFEAFWQSYPRHADRPGAEKVWRSLAPDAGLQRQIVEALQWQSLQPRWHEEGGRFVPFPAKWLRGRRWEDQPDLPARPSRSDSRTGQSVAAAEEYLAGEIATLTVPEPLQILAAMAGISKHETAQFFAGASLRHDGGVITLHVTDDITAKFVRRCYRGRLERVAQRRDPSIARLEVLAPGDDSDTSSRFAHDAADSLTLASSGVGLPAIDTTAVDRPTSEAR